MKLGARCARCAPGAADAGRYTHWREGARIESGIADEDGVVESRLCDARFRALLSDFIVLPMQYAVVRPAGEWAFVWQGWLLLLAGAAAIFSFRNWRCPASDRYLGKQMSLRFCSKCGVVLR